MIYCGLAVIFFVITFGPRFYTLMNFGYGFTDLGLYSQALYQFSKFDFNPLIPSMGEAFFNLKSQPFLWLLTPFVYVMHPQELLLLIDELAIVAAAAACARLAYKRLQSPSASLAVFIAVLFSAMTMDSLHGPARVTLWAQAPLAWLLLEYFTLRRRGHLILWSVFLTLIDLNFGVLVALIGVLTLVTRRDRWNLSWRTLTAAPLLLVSGAAVYFLYYWGRPPIFDRELFFQVHRSALFQWQISFWFLPLLCPEVLILAVAGLMVRFGSAFHDPALLIPLGAVGAVMTMERLRFDESWVRRLFTAGIISTTVYFNFLSEDPLFEFWKSERRSISLQSQNLHKLVGQVPEDGVVAATDGFTPHLATNPQLLVLGGPGVLRARPDMILSLNEPTPFDGDRSYRLVESIPESGARLLKRIK